MKTIPVSALIELLQQRQQQVKIARLKKRAQQLVNARSKRLDRWDCGNAMVAMVDSEANRLQRELDDVLAQLRAIDPAFPQ